MRKRIFSVMLAMTLLIGTCSVAVADESKSGATRNNLKSYGSIEYHKGDDKVVINSDDLYMLADQIDQIKLNVTNQLEGMNTYFTAGDGISLRTADDISISHSQPSEGDKVNPLSVNFDTMLEGIAASQSISKDVSDYGYPSGTKLYSVGGSLTTDGSDKDAEEVMINPADEKNLSAGAAAWVNGELIIGNGADNNYYYKEGVQDGQADVIANPKEYGVPGSISYFYLNGGGLYGVNGTQTFTIPRDGTYKFVVKTAWKNTHTNFALANKVTLKIGSETTTVFNHQYVYGENCWKTEGSTDKTITKKCTAGTKITMTVTGASYDDDDVIFTVSSFLIY